MSKYIVNNKIYDTAKAEKIIDFKRKKKHETLFIDYNLFHEAILYKSQKGQFFIQIGKVVESGYYSCFDMDEIELITEDKVKDLLIDLKLIDKYIELFGELEEG